MACLSDRLPFETTSNAETMDKILNASYVLPEGISPEIQDLMVKLLEIVSYITWVEFALNQLLVIKNSIRRIQPADALSHPFFNVNLPVTPLSPDLSEASDSVLRKHSLFESLSKKSVSPFPYGQRKPQRHSYAPNKTAIDDPRSSCPRTSLFPEISARRIVSDPLPLKQRHGTPEAGPSNSSPLSQTSEQATPQTHQGRKDTGSRVPNDPSAASPVSARLTLNEAAAYRSPRRSPSEPRGLCHLQRRY